MANNNVSKPNPQLPSDAGLFSLPTRREKRIIPVGAGARQGSGQSFTADDFEITAALQPFQDYILIRIPGRGRDSSGNPDPSQSAYFKFLINPQQLSVSREHADSQALSRSGWQIGIAGEEPIRVTFDGKSPGKFFANGLTDLMSDYSLSYRHLQALEVVFENNGYRWEGEEVDTVGAYASGAARRQIKSHSSIELTCGEFVWTGMFESLEIEEDAENPYFLSFSMSFVAWKEHFLPQTPYIDPIAGAIERGHTFVVPGQDNRSILHTINSKIATSLSPDLPDNIPTVAATSSEQLTEVPLPVFTPTSREWNQP
jgi:hypothetical protein